MLFLATAVMFASPVAAKANQQYSYFAGIHGAMQRYYHSSGGEKALFDARYNNKKLWAFGIEGGFGGKVYNDLRVDGFLQGRYALAPTYALTGEDIYGFEVQPTVTLGWEFPMGQFSLTPFAGLGLEATIAKPNEKYKLTFLPRVVGGLRLGAGPMYVSANFQWDLMSQAADSANKELVADKEKMFGRSWCVQLALGLEF